MKELDGIVLHQEYKIKCTSRPPRRLGLFDYQDQRYASLEVMQHELYFSFGWIVSSILKFMLNSYLGTNTFKSWFSSLETC